MSEDRTSSIRPSSTGRGVVYASGSLLVLEEALGTALEGLRQSDPLAPIQVIVPSNLLGSHLRRSLLPTQGHANIRFGTMLDVAREMAEARLLAGGIREIPALAERILLRDVLEEALPEGGYFPRFVEGRGLGDVMLATLHDLMEARISAEELEISARSQKLKEIARVYRIYLERLSSLGLVSREEVMEAAIRTPPADGKEEFPIAVYGFYDLTPLQKGILQRVSQVRDLLIFFPYRGGEAFTYALPTLSWFKSAGFAVRQLAEHERDASNLEALQKRIFEREGQGPPPDDTVEVISAPGEWREAREIVRRILSLAREGVNLSEIGIFLRQPEPYTRLLGEALEEAGVSYHVPDGPSLAESRAGLALCLLMRLPQCQYRRDRVMELIALLGVPWEAASRWDRVSASAGIVAGRSQWEERLQRVMAAQQGEKGADAAALHDFLQGIWQAWDGLPQRGPWERMTLALKSFVLAHFQKGGGIEEVCEVLDGLGEMDLLGKEVTLEAFFSLLGSVLSETRSKKAKPGRGVSIVNLMVGRGLTFRVVFVPGMVDRSFPLALHQDPILLDEERRIISLSLGKELPERKRGVEEERLLFTLALMAAHEKVVLSFPRIDSMKGRDRVPSFFLLDVARILPGLARSAEEPWPCTKHVSAAQAEPGDIESCVDRVDLGLWMAARARKAHDSGALFSLGQRLPFFQQAVRADRERWQRKSLGPYDGVLQSQEAKRLWARRCPSGFSPTALELYARCPFQYFLESVLKVLPVERPEDVDVVSPADRGGILHRALCKLFSELKGRGMLPLNAGGKEEAHRLVAEIAEREFRACEENGVPGSPLLWELETKGMAEALHLTVEESANQKGMVPEFFEKSFKKIPFPLPGGDSIFLQGKIDRIDFASDGGCRVIDYKTGKYRRMNESSVRRGDALQIPLYLFAAKELYPERASFEGEYLFVSAEGGIKKCRFQQDADGKRDRVLQETVATLIMALRDGRFHPYPKDCSCWNYQSVCGKNAEAVFGRKEADPALEPFLRLRQKQEGGKG